jgi:hypothetical protein
VSTTREVAIDTPESGPRRPGDPAVSPAPPPWFSPKRTASAGGGSASAKQLITVAEERPFVRPATLAGWCVLLWSLLWEWWTGLYLGWGLTTSLLFHLSVALGLAFVVYAQNDKPGLLVNGEFAEQQDGDDLEVPLDSRLDTSYGDNQATLAFSAASATFDGELTKSAEDLIGGLQGDGEETGDGAGDLMKNIRVPESAITKGSFTVWTEPEDPKPRVPYDIIIQVKLPPNVKQYRLSDLSGYVEGTDGYRKQIKYTSKDRKGVKDGVVQFSIRIPGGAQLVRDVIEIRSKILDEQQRIEIEF